MTTAKPFDIPKREVWEAFKKVKANQGAAGVDGQTIAEFEAGLVGNLYKLWNRLSSGSYFPPPVRRVDIPKASGGTRPLGIPTVADRVAQEVVRRYLEPCLEPVFHADSYGYPAVTFDFLGYSFRPRLAAWRGGKYGVSFLPAAADTALKRMREEVRRWSLQTRTDKALDDLARMFNPRIRGWINYYSHFYKSALYDTLRRIDFHLRKWARRKYKRFRHKPKGARVWFARIIGTSPTLFVHWQLLHATRLDTGSRMS